MSLTPIAACNALADMPAGTASITTAAEVIETVLGSAFAVGTGAEPAELPTGRMEGLRVGAAGSRQRLRGGCGWAGAARAVAHSHSAASCGAGTASVAPL